MIQNHLSKSSFCIKTHPAKYYHLPYVYIQSNNFARNIFTTCIEQIESGIEEVDRNTFIQKCLFLFAGEI